MDWQDDGIVLTIHRHGEAGVILELLTREHGRHKGYVRGGAGRRMRGILQPGNDVNATWKSRVEGNLGTYSIELTKSRVGELMGQGDRMLALSAIAATCSTLLPERETHLPVYDAMRATLDLLAEADVTAVDWGVACVTLELGLLQELGFGLDLSCCAATGVTDDLEYVSPRTGKAVSREAGHPYRERLLVLPPFLHKNSSGTPQSEDVLNGLVLTGRFLDLHVARPIGKRLPAARARFEDSFRNRL